MPRVDNIKTEDLSPEQLERLLKAIEEDECIQAAAIMKMALYTGMRRGEIFRLKWVDIDFERNFVRLRDNKGGKTQSIPLNEMARHLLENHPKHSEFVFPGRNGGKRTDVNHQIKPY